MSLPPLPAPWRIDDEDEDHYSKDQVQAYGQQCRDAALEDAANLCNGEQWVTTEKSKSVDYIKAFNEGCTDCGAVIRRLK